MIFTNFTLHATLATQSLCRLHPSRPSRLVRYGKKNAWHKASPTSWPCWHSRYGIHQHRRISVGTSGHGAALGHCGHRLFRFSMCRSDALISVANDPSAMQHLQLGTLCLLLSSTVTLSLCLNLGWKLTCSTPHIASLPVPPAPLKLRHYGALQMFYYYYYYYYYYYVRPGFESTKKDVQLWMSMFMKPPTKLNCLRKREPSEWKNVSK